MRDQSNLFVFYKKHTKIKLQNLIDELHNAYVTRNSYYKIIKQYKEQIDKSPISFNRIEMIYRNKAKSKVIIPADSKILDDEEQNQHLIELIKYYSYIYITKIPELRKLIRLYEFISTCPYNEMIKIVREFNRESAKRVLQGEDFIMPCKIGGFKVEFVKRPPDKKAINWKESNIYKRYLLANGRVPANYENPDGEEWLIYFTDDYYLRWSWMKRYCKTSNGYMYSFVTTNYNNLYDEFIEDFEKKVTTKEEILDSKVLGNLQKALMLSRKFNDIKELYSYGI